MPARRIHLRTLGSTEDKGHVRLTEFIRQLELVRNALKQTEREMTGDEGRVYWRIVDLSHDSPATVVLEEVVPKLSLKERRERQRLTPAERKATERPPIIDEFINVMRGIRLNAAVPEGRRSLAVLESYRELSSVTDKHIASFQIEAKSKTVKIDDRFRKNIDAIIGPDEIMEGSLNGVVEAINLHNTLRFNLYPVVGPKKVTGAFPEHLKRKVIEAIDRYVRVEGTLRYKSWAPFPHAIDVTDIHVLPAEDDLPTLDSLRGIAPKATGTQSSEEFVLANRDASW